MPQHSCACLHMLGAFWNAIHQGVLQGEVVVEAKSLGGS